MFYAINQAESDDESKFFLLQPKWIRDYKVSSLSIFTIIWLWNIRVFKLYGINQAERADRIFFLLRHKWDMR